jgi:hypothetical protein
MLAFESTPSAPPLCVFLRNGEIENIQLIIKISLIAGALFSILTLIFAIKYFILNRRGLDKLAIKKYLLISAGLVAVSFLFYFVNLHNLELMCSGDISPIQGSP